MNRISRFLVDDICHLYENRPKIDAQDIVTDTSVGSQYHNLLTASAFSTSKIDLNERLMMCYNPN